MSSTNPLPANFGTEVLFDVATKSPICCHIDFSSLLCRDGVRGWNWSPLHGLSARPGVGGWWGNSQSCGYYVFLTTIIIILSGDTTQYISTLSSSLSFSTLTISSEYVTGELIPSPSIVPQHWGPELGEFHAQYRKR